MWYFDKFTDSGKKKKDYKIYSLKSYNNNLTKARAQAKEALDFKIEMVNNFSGISDDEIRAKYTCWAPHVNGGIPQVIYKENDDYWGNFWKTEYSWNIGINMICDKYGMITGFNERVGDYYAIPLNQLELIKWVDENSPSFTKIIKRING